MQDQCAIELVGQGLGRVIPVWRLVFIFFVLAASGPVGAKCATAKLVVEIPEWIETSDLVALYVDGYDRFDYSDGEAREQGRIVLQVPRKKSGFGRCVIKAREGDVVFFRDGTGFRIRVKFKWNGEFYHARIDEAMTSKLRPCD